MCGHDKRVWSWDLISLYLSEKFIPVAEQELNGGAAVANSTVSDINIKAKAIDRSPDP